MSIGSSPGVVPTFYPTYDEFKDFSTFIESIEARGAHKIGLAKIVPPKEWKARRSGYKSKQISDRFVENPIKQEVHGRDGVYSVFNIQQRSVKVSSFEKMATSNRYASPSVLSNNFEQLEKKYWQSITSAAPIYGADVSGSLYDEDQDIWNVNNLGTILDDLSTEYGAKIQGVNTAYLYYGMWKASFAWHTEDMDLYSINYLHFGAPKQWYVIPPSFGRKFEQFASSCFPSLARRCPAFLRHKMTIVSPSVLTKNSIPYSKIIQNEGEFIITFPFGYHSGFNYGFNCAESTNFALERWIEYGKHSIKCTCRSDMVKISMDRFVLKYQPELYESWSRGINMTPHPEDKKMSIEVRPNKQVDLTQSISLDQENSPSIFTVQQQHQQNVTNERYALIFRSLSEYDQQKPFLISHYPNSQIRAALCRANEQMINNSTSSFRTLLSLTANLISANVLTGTKFHLFQGLQQSGKYREQILDGLWNHQNLLFEAERAFHKDLHRQSYSCSICYLFTANKINEFRLKRSSSFINQLWPENRSKSSSNPSEIDDELLKCAACSISVHRQCYENVCLAMNVQLNEEYEPWLCQRCILQQKATIDDRCSSCLLRVGLVLCSESSANTFQHPLCTIYAAYHQPHRQHNGVCEYCWSFCPLNYRKTSTQQLALCHYSKCTTNFHVTCGLISGCTFSFDNEHQIINARCHLHASHVDEMMSKNENVPLSDGIVAEDQRLANGTRVVVEGKIGQIIRNEISYHYSVDFGDDTFSHDMLTEDILHSDPSTLTINSMIRVRWTDGTIYSCKYLGRKRVLLYHIKIDDDIRQLQRQEFSVDIQPPSPPPTPCSMDSENNSFDSLTTAMKTKRANTKEVIKRKRCRRLLLSSSSSSDDES